MSMTFADLKTELSDRGFSYLSDTRLGRYINDAKNELDECQLWPYREASATGTAPLTVSDLGVIEAVVDTTAHRTLTPMSYQNLLDQYGDLSKVGLPYFYYVAWPAGVPVVATFPTSSSATIGVQYWKTTADLSSASDVPASPGRFHNLIVDIAVRRAYFDADNAIAAANLQQEIDRRMQMMVDALLTTQTQGPQFMLLSDLNHMDT